MEEKKKWKEALEFFEEFNELYQMGKLTDDDGIDLSEDGELAKAEFECRCKDILGEDASVFLSAINFDENNTGVYMYDAARVLVAYSAMKEGEGFDKVVWTILRKFPSKDYDRETLEYEIIGPAVAIANEVGLEYADKSDFDDCFSYAEESLQDLATGYLPQNRYFK